MASSASGQDDPDRAMWLATRAGKMEPSCPLGTTRYIPQENFPESHIISPLLTKFVRSMRLDICLVFFLFASLWTSTSSRSTNTQKKNLANIQPSRPHTWSITHIYKWNRHIHTRARTVHQIPIDYHCRISFREGLGTSLCVMGLSTQEPYIQKEQNELYKILKFRVNWANIEQDTAIHKLRNLPKKALISGHLFRTSVRQSISKFLNGCILFNIGPIDTKLEDFVKLGMLFQNVWVL